MRLYCTPGSPYARMARIVVLEKQLGSRVEVIFAKTRAKGRRRARATDNEWSTKRPTGSSGLGGLAVE